ncbi:unnamed protein product [Nippostrongylus brasiliensis]|uniref:Transcriptional regulator n=1 Tax=Nippostrongylus brasiliensis TaxID=27835 RepID=A0A0N4YD75_NIPBR|nr:unnamed protein product [Nippostrongylus brasiliensis]
MGEKLVVKKELISVSRRCTAVLATCSATEREIGMLLL